MVRVGISGFGRIGRGAFRVALERHATEVDMVGINDLIDPATLMHLLKYDSVYKSADHQISAGEDHIIVDGKKYPIVSQKEPSLIPWKDLGAEVVIECTGRFTASDAAAGHLKAGAKRVVISAPSDDAPTFILGVNPYDGNSQVINNGSCTTNCVGPVTAVMQANFKILKAFMTTVHAYTAEQNLVDGPPPALHKDLRRARASAVNIVPTTTGAARAVAKAFRELEGKFDGAALRVPVVCGSVSDFHFVVANRTTVEEVNEAFRRAEGEPNYAGILAVTEDPIVSSDIIGRSESAIVDLLQTKVVDGDLVRVLAWYDNEWGYANRLVEQAITVGRSVSS